MIRWVINGLIPADALTILAGEPGCGKSLLAQCWAGQLSCAGIGTLLLSAEDHPWAVISPRLTACNANKNLIIAPSQPPRLPEDIASLQQIVVQHHPQLLILDLLDSFSSLSLSHADNAHRILGPLIALAQSQHLGVLGLLHTGKQRRRDLNALLGSVELAGLARSVLLLEPYEPQGAAAAAPDNATTVTTPTKRLLHIKCNLGPLHEDLLFRIETVQIPGGITVPQIVFEILAREPP
jgi:putative DNA primase/helicase